MSLSPYSEYRSSRIDWAGRLPAHWDVARLRWISQRYSGGTPDKNRPEFWQDGTVPWLNSGAVNNGKIHEPSAYITQEALGSSSAKWIPAGALLMALAGQGKTKGMVAQLMFESTCNQSMAAIVPDGRIAARYLYWWLASNYQNIRNMAGGDLRDGLNLELLGAIPCPLPSSAEQAAIAAFLDYETAKIDALIAEQEKLLALLAEKHQATISHAVTRGLDPSAKMEDSGIPWLGVVPAHWDLVPCRFLVLERNERNEDAANQDYLSLMANVGVIPYAEKGDVGNKKPEDLSKCKLVKVGDLVINSMNYGIGSYGLSPLSGVCSPVYIVLEVKQSAALREFVYRIFQNRGFQLFAQSHGNGILAHRAAIGWDTLKGLQVALPTLDEQRGIVEFVNSIEDTERQMRTEGERAVALLQERRSALIVAAVTGQIDVRGAMEMHAA